MKISIVIPVYNVEPYIARCLDGLLAQKFGNWEAICIDDGSSDGSGAILDSYAKRDSRFVVRHQENKGVSAARNLGLSLVSGDWFGFVDADDFVEDNWLARADEWLGAVSIDMISFGQVTETENGKVIEIHKPTKSRQIVDVSVALSEELFDIGFTMTLYRTALFRDIRFGSYIVGEDRLYTVHCLMRASQVALDPYIAYHYVIRNASATRQRLSSRKVFDRISYNREVLDTFSAGKKRVPSQVIKNFLMLLIRSYQKNLIQLERELDPQAEELRRYWRDSVLYAKRLPIVPSHIRTLMTLILMARIRFVSMALVSVPSKVVGFMKKMGV